jgi:hypothetical protein
MQSIKAGIGQSLFDIALQYCGSIESAMDIALSASINVDTDTQTGTQFKVPDVINTMIVDYYAKNNLVPATAINTDTIGEGIGYWLIENDFIVQ